MRNPLAIAAVGLLAISLPAAGAQAQLAIESKRVAFLAGATSTLPKGQLKGRQTVD